MLQLPPPPLTTDHPSTDHQGQGLCWNPLGLEPEARGSPRPGVPLCPPQHLGVPPRSPDPAEPAQLHLRAAPKLSRLCQGDWKFLLSSLWVISTLLSRGRGGGRPHSLGSGSAIRSGRDSAGSPCPSEITTNNQLSVAGAQCVPGPALGHG